MTDFAVNVTIEAGDYDLTYLARWGQPWSEKPTSISSGDSATFTLDTNDRGGIWYRALDPDTKDEVGFVCMSFTCPKMSDNAAEGSPSDGDLLISAGLQTYEESGHPLDVTYKVGQENKACWSSGSSDDGSIECSQTDFGDRRAVVTFSNPKLYDLRFGEYWNDNGNGAYNWYWEPDIDDLPPPGCKRTVLLKDNDRAGIFFVVLDEEAEEQLGFANASFICPKSSDNAAEGSPGDSDYLVDAGLQTYEESGTPVTFEFQIGNKNEACWGSGSSDDGKTVCDQTTFEDRRVLVVAKNSFAAPLRFEEYWNDNSLDEKNWYVEPSTYSSIPPNCQRFFVLKDNDRAGVYYTIDYLEYHLSFTCPKMTDNAAEGSAYAGLQGYSETGTPVTFTYLIGTPNLACWESGNSDDGKIVCPQTKVQPENLDSWMNMANEANDSFQSRNLTDTFLPGAHDAACYSSSSVATPWVQTQDQDFGSQLRLGVRYLDLRPSYNRDTLSGDQYHGFHHGGVPVAATLDDLIEQVEAFYTDDWSARQNEIVIFDFTHFNNYDDDTTKQAFFDVLHESALGEYFVPPGTTLTPASIWNASAKGRVIASVNFDPSAFQNTDEIWTGAGIFTSGWDGTAFWADTDDQATLISFLNTIFSNRVSYSGLWVMQDILTPGPTSSVSSLSDEAHAALFGISGAAWMPETNIVIQDYFDIRTTVEAIYQGINRT